MKRDWDFYKLILAQIMADPKIVPRPERW